MLDAYIGLCEIHYRILLFLLLNLLFNIPKISKYAKRLIIVVAFWFAPE